MGGTNMATKQTTKQRPRMKKMKRRQGHKLVWFTVILIAIPVVFVLYVLLMSSFGQNKPVTGSRFKNGNLDPQITKNEIGTIQTDLAGIGGVEKVEVILKSATLRISMDCSDSADQEAINAIVEEAYDRVMTTLPEKTYFKNSENSKMYDLEIGGYNYIVDDTHSADNQIYIKITKTGAGSKVVDVLSSPKDEDLVNQITR